MTDLPGWLLVLTLMSGDFAEVEMDETACIAAEREMASAPGPVVVFDASGQVVVATAAQCLSPIQRIDPCICQDREEAGS
jgi:hypothetical protein